MNDPQNRSKIAGFTLIELLTVIAVIAILAGILIPTIGKVRDRAANSTCVSNLRQIGVAMSLYAQNSGGLLPAANDSDKDPGIWVVTISEYLQQQLEDTASENVIDVFRCPIYAQLSSTENLLQGNNTHWNQFGYGMSINLDGHPQWGRPGYQARLSQIENPARTILVADHDNWNWDVSPDNIESVLNSHAMTEKALRHGDTANYLFVDGHVEALSLDQLAAHYR